MVTLYDGRAVSSWSGEWLEETRARFTECLHVFRLPDREARRDYLAKYEARIVGAAAANFHADPAAVGAEARRRLEATIMERWHAQQAAAAATAVPNPP